MVRKFVNSDVHHRVWPNLQDADGHTVGLAPGETVDLDVPDDFEDFHLKPEPLANKPPRLRVEPAPTVEEPAE